MGGVFFMEGAETNTCKNVFINKSAEERVASFTTLWVNVINEKEKKQPLYFENEILQAKISGV